MRKWISRLVTKSVSIEVLTRFHMWAILFWGLTIIPSVLWWHASVLWVIILSWWALVATHWGAWQAARSELLSKQQLVSQLHDMAHDVEDVSNGKKVCPLCNNPLICQHCAL